MSMPKVKAAIIIRTYNEAEFLTRVLDAIMAQSEEFFKIVIVDSGSTDQTVMIARSYPQVKVVEITQAEFSFGYALNVGISEVAERVVYAVMVSGHAVPINQNWLAELLAPFENYQDVVGVYGKQLPMPEHLANPIVRTLAKDAFPSCYGDEAYVGLKKGFFSNANAAISLTAWKRLKFNEKLPGSEDCAWAIEMESLGGRIAYQPTAAVYHSHPDSFWRYVRRISGEFRGLRLVKSEGDMDMPREGITGFLCRFWSALRRYLHNLRKQRTFVGEHFDWLRLNTAISLARLFSE